MESKKINQLATELAPDLSDLTIIGDPTTGISKKITLSQMASLFTGTVEEYATLAAFPLVGVADTIYIALDTNIIYRYDTSLSAYVILSPNIINSLVFSDANGFDGTITLVGSVATLSITTALTLGSVPFIGASGALTQDNANLFFDDTNNRLGIATASPTTPLDVFGSGIIGRLNATSTNNSYLGFASNGTNKWSAGNVQSDHRFRIFSEANSSELITILQTGEFGIGISNPTTKFHIDGAASALIANLDANVSVAKSISFRSDNSNRINLEVSGTESGSNAGADLFIRRYSDAGSLIDTPLTITRSTGALTFSTITNITNSTASTSTTTGALIVTGGVGIGGALFGTSATFSGNVTAAGLIGTGLYSNSWYAGSGSTLSLRTAASGVIADFSPTSSNILGNVGINGSTAPAVALTVYDTTSGSEQLRLCNSNGGGYWAIGRENNVTGDLYFNSGGTFRVAFKANGNVLIGSSTAPSSIAVSDLLVIGKSGSASNAINFSNGSTTNWGYVLAESAKMVLGSGSSSRIAFETNAGSERGRFTSGGYFKATNTGTYVHSERYHELITNNSTDETLVIANSSTGNAFGTLISYRNVDPNNTTCHFIYCEASGGTQRMSVKSNGGIYNYSANNVNLSDISTKKDIIACESYWDKFKAIEIVKFKYIDQTHDDFNIGVIAQQVEKVAPEFIDEENWSKDEENPKIMKAIYTEDLHHATIKVLQEAMAKIEILEEEIKLLKNK